MVFFFFVRMCDYSFFFFSSRRRHTRCGRDWNSDVCSSDLVPDCGPGPDGPGFGGDPTNDGFSSLRCGEIDDAEQRAQTRSLSVQARHVQPGRGVGADQPVQRQVAAGPVKTVVGRAEQAWDERLQLLASDVVELVVEVATESADDAGHARR